MLYQAPLVEHEHMVSQCRTEGQVLGSIATGQLRVARASPEHVKVVMCGEGADEMLGGYSWYPTLPLLEPLFMLPRAARLWIARLSPIRRRWPGAAGTIAGPREMDFERYSSSISHLATQSAAARLFSAEVLDALGRDAPSPEAPPPPPGFDAWHPFARMQYFDIQASARLRRRAEPPRHDRWRTRSRHAFRSWITSWPRSVRGSPLASR